MVLSFYFITRYVCNLLRVSRLTQRTAPSRESIDLVGFAQRHHHLPAPLTHPISPALSPAIGYCRAPTYGSASVRPYR